MFKLSIPLVRTSSLKEQFVAVDLVLDIETHKLVTKANQVLEDGSIA